MISGLTKVLLPVIGPLLRLRTDPPHLPEGSSAVRTLKPSARYLSYRYLGVLALAVPALAGALGGAAALLVELGRWGVPLVLLVAGVPLFITAVALVATRMDWELRHYLIGDRSLRVRQGAFVQQEVTLSFANVQNVEVTQGPLERLFGFKNVRVTTAGGAAITKEAQHTFHGANLVGLANAEAIRDLMLSTLRKQRDSGLGDPDDAKTAPPSEEALLSEVLDAARELRTAAERRG